MRPYSRWIFVAILAVQLAWLCADARDWCLWLPGLTLCAAGLLADRRAHLGGNTMFWMVCLVLYVIAPASQLSGNYFRGETSVTGIHFSDAIIMRTIALADAFMAAALIMQLIMRRLTPQRGMGGAAGVLGPATPLAIPPAAATLPATATASAGSSGRDGGDDGIASSSGDDQAFILVDDPGEFRHLRAIPDEPARTEPPFEEDDQDYILVDDPGEFRNLRSIQDEDQLPESPAEEASAPPAQATPVIADEVAAILDSRALAIAMALISIAVPAATCLMLGSLDFVTNGREFTMSAFSDSAWGTLINSSAQDLMVILTLLGIERWLRNRTTGNGLLLAFIAVFTLVMINPLNTARYQFGAVMIMVLLFSCRGRFPIALTYAGIALYMYAVMPLMNLLRTGVSGLQGQHAAIGIDFNTLDYDCFSMFTFAVYRTALEDFAYGRFLCSSLLFFLPRSWWPDKPRPSSIDLGQYLMQHHSGWFDNLSCPPMGDGYMDFGLAGVLGLGLGFGYLVERSDQLIDRWSSATFVSRGLAAAAVAFLPILLRGSLGAVLGFVIAPVVILLALRVVAPWFPRALHHGAAAPIGMGNAMMR